MVLRFNFSPTRCDCVFRKRSELCSRAARQGGLLGWREWNGFTMETAGKRPEKEAIWRWAASEHALIKRPCEALGAAFLQPRRMNVERRPHAWRHQFWGTLETRHRWKGKGGKQCNTHRAERRGHQVWWEQIPVRRRETNKVKKKCLWAHFVCVNFSARLYKIDWGQCSFRGQLMFLMVAFITGRRSTLGPYHQLSVKKKNEMQSVFSQAPFTQAAHESTVWKDVWVSVKSLIWVLLICLLPVSLCTWILPKFTHLGLNVSLDWVFII